MCRDPKLTCTKMCLSCRGKAARVVRRTVLIDHLEANIFDNGSITLGMFSSKLLIQKGSIWVDKVVDIKVSDAHEITIMMWLNNIFNIHWSGSDISSAKAKTKQNLNCSFQERTADAAIRMNHNDGSCWITIPYV